MNDNSIYVLDANVFIEAKNRYYAFDIVPPFWDNLVIYAERKRILSIDRIKKQLEDGNDDLSQWIKGGNMDEAFIATDQTDVIESYQEVIS